MKKRTVFFVMFSLLLGFGLFTGCEQPNKSVGDDIGTSVVLFNPTDKPVKIVKNNKSRTRSATENNEVDEIPPKTSKNVTLAPEGEYFFTDENGNKIADLAKGDNGAYMPVYLELNEPVVGKEYLCLNQYKNTDAERNPNSGIYSGTYSVMLFEVVDADALDAYKYDDDTYIRTYPSANLWVNKNIQLGQTITFDSYEELAGLAGDTLKIVVGPWVAWGWSTKEEISGLYFCHRMISYVLKTATENTPSGSAGEDEFSDEEIQLVHNGMTYYYLESRTVNNLYDRELNIQKYSYNDYKYVVYLHYNYFDQEKKWVANSGYAIAVRKKSEALDVVNRMRDTWYWANKPEAGKYPLIEGYEEFLNQEEAIKEALGIE